jgi:hypothetical protein
MSSTQIAVVALSSLPSQNSVRIFLVKADHKAEAERQIAIAVERCHGQFHFHQPNTTSHVRTPSWRTNIVKQSRCVKLPPNGSLAIRDSPGPQSEIRSGYHPGTTIIPWRVDRRGVSDILDFLN